MQILFSGCSLVQGVGLDQMAQDSCNLANIIGQTLNGNVTNIAIRGNSNERIFLDTALALAQQKYDIVFVCWTSYPRHVFWPGLEPYECRRSLGPTQVPIIEHNGNDVSWSSAEFERIRQWFVTLMHDHYSILDICRYCKVLKTLSELQGGRVYFVNSLTAWDTGYFEQFDRLGDTPVKPDMLTTYTNELLNSENRDDEQIDVLFRIIQQDLAQAGGIHSQHWLNLYQSLISLKIDTGNDINQHPGPLSHKKYAELLLTQLNQNTAYT